VLDPTRMNTIVANVEMQHGHLVAKLTKALFACIRRFYEGWDVDTEMWQEYTQFTMGPAARCKINTTYDP
jgi:hypothetical protein